MPKKQPVEHRNYRVYIDVPVNSNGLAPSETGTDQEFESLALVCFDEMYLDGHPLSFERLPDEQNVTVWKGSGENAEAMMWSMPHGGSEDEWKE